MRPIAILCKRAMFVAALAAILTLAGNVSAQGFGGDLLKSSPKVVKLFRQVVAKTSESTVRVQCNGKDAALGAVIGPDGWIITKYSELKGEIICKLKDGKEYSAKIVGMHAADDLALLKIEATGLKTIDWANSADAKVGRFVATASIGEDPVAIGVISVATRKFVLGDQPPKTLALDSGYLGVMLEDAMGAAKVTFVEPKSAADKAGLKMNDIITRINDKKILGAESMINTIQKYKPGEEVTIKVTRGDDEPIEIKAKLDKRPAKLLGNPQERMGSVLSNRRGGFEKILQHDTIIKPTDCGGPLVDLDGKVVGINIARAGRSESYAIPSEAVRELLLPMMSGMLPPPSDDTDPPGKK